MTAVPTLLRASLVKAEASKLGLSVCCCWLSLQLATAASSAAASSFCKALLQKVMPLYRPSGQLRLGRNIFTAPRARMTCGPASDRVGLGDCRPAMKKRGKSSIECLERSSFAPQVPRTGSHLRIAPHSHSHLRDLRCVCEDAISLLLLPRKQTGCARSIR